MSGTTVWQIVIQKLYGTEYYVNDYHVIASGLAQAKQIGGQIVTAEKAIHRTDVSFVNMRLRVLPGGTQGTVVPVGGTGVVESTSYLPLFNTVRVDFSPEAGRPGRKYLRLPLGNASVAGPRVVNELLNAITSSYVNPLLGLGVLCKEDASVFVTASVIAAVQMRQIRRGSKRRLQPII